MLIYYVLNWDLVVEPAVLSAVTHAPTRSSSSDITPMFVLDPSLVSAAPTSLSVGASRVGVEQDTPWTLLGSLWIVVELGWSKRATNPLHSLNHLLVESLVTVVQRVALHALERCVPLGEQLLVAVWQLVASSSACLLKANRAEELFNVICCGHSLEVFLE